MNLANATHLRCLMWYDGPWIEYYEADGKKYITKYHNDLLNGVPYDYPENALHRGHPSLDERWLVIELTDETEVGYFAGAMSLLEIIDKAPALYLGPFNCAGKGAEELTLVNRADLREEDLPTKDSYYEYGYEYPPL